MSSFFFFFFLTYDLWHTHTDVSLNFYKGIPVPPFHIYIYVNITQWNWWVSHYYIYYIFILTPNPNIELCTVLCIVMFNLAPSSICRVGGLSLQRQEFVSRLWPKGKSDVCKWSYVSKLTYVNDVFLCEWGSFSSIHKIHYLKCDLSLNLTK